MNYADMSIQAQDTMAAIYAGIVPPQERRERELLPNLADHLVKVHTVSKEAW